MYSHTRVVTGEKRFRDMAVRVIEPSRFGRLKIFTCCDPSRIGNWKYLHALMLLDNFKSLLCDLSTAKPVLSGHSK